MRERRAGWHGWCCLGAVRSLWHELARWSCFAALLLAAFTPSLTDAQARLVLGPPSAHSASSEHDLTLTEEPSGRTLSSPYAPQPALGEFDLEVTAGTVFPLAVGVGVRVGHQSGLFFDVWAGGIPTGYAELAGEGAGAYGVRPGPRALLEGLLDGAGLLRLSLGVRPLRDVGVELSLGYSLLYAAPTLARTTLEAATGQSLRPASDQISMALAVHALHLELGYGLVLFDHLLLRATVGGALAVGADFRVNVPESMRSPGGAIEQVEQGVASSIPGRVFIPTARIEAGVHF